MGQRKLVERVCVWGGRAAERTVAERQIKKQYGIPTREVAAFLYSFYPPYPIYKCS